MGNLSFVFHGEQCFQQVSSLNKRISNPCAMDKYNVKLFMRIPVNSASSPPRKRPPFRRDFGRCSDGKAASF